MPAGESAHLESKIPADGSSFFDFGPAFFGRESALFGTVAGTGFFSPFGFDHRLHDQFPKSLDGGGAVLFLRAAFMRIEMDLICLGQS